MYKKKRKKYLCSSHVDGKRQPAKAKNGGKIAFAVRVDAKSLYKHGPPSRESFHYRYLAVNIAESVRQDTIEY